MKQKLIDSLKMRVASEIQDRNQLKYLQEFRVEDYIDTVISVVYLYTGMKRRSRKNNTVYFVEVVAAIGHSVRSRLKLRKDSGLAAKTGAFMLYSFQELGILEVIMGYGMRGHHSYIVQLQDETTLLTLWETVTPGNTEKLPSEKPFSPWRSYRHDTGAVLVRTNNKDVLNALSPRSHPLVFECVNKAQEVGWRVNDFIYFLHLWALRNKTEAFSDIWEQSDQEARATKTREARAIGSIARRFIGKTFYHMYYYDFRGRRYPTTAYLHEQGSDLARGLLLRDDAKPIGKEGFFWLMVALASHWAGDSGREDSAKTDKIPMKERYLWAIDNEEILLSYAESPKVNQGWMRADKPWQFLAACHELAELRRWQFESGEGEDRFEDYGYSSSLEVFIDGSTNGSQHLCALTRDDVTAPYVNLVPLELPGDLYSYVSEHVWSRVEEDCAKLTREEVEECERTIDTLMEMKKRVGEAAPKSEQRKELISEMQSYKDSNRLLMDVSAPVFWRRIKEPRQRRKVIKRNVMTLPYGGTPYGLGEQIIDDSKKHGIEALLNMEHRWGAYLGRLVYEDCRVSLSRPMQLLRVFERAGEVAEEAGRFLSWTVPITHFPVVQNYTEGKVKKVWVQYGPPYGEKLSTGFYANTLQLSVCFVEDTKPSKDRQSRGASPNAIHSLDAAHMVMTVCRADFPVTTVHDSYGCLLADMPELFKLVRETFVELYTVNPLEGVMEDIGGDMSNVEFGTLDVRQVLESEYCFS